MDHPSTDAGFDQAAVGLTLGVWYRIWQFWQTLTGQPTSQDLDRAAQLLTPEQWQLFQRLQPSEQAHSLRILQALDDQWDAPTDLRIAALLHDVGKVEHPLRIWERVEIVLTKALLPEKVKKWGQGEPRGWRRPFVVAEQHAQWGAQLAEQAGASPLVVNLIRWHQEHRAAAGNLTGLSASEERWLRILQQYDGNL